MRIRDSTWDATWDAPENGKGGDFDMLRSESKQIAPTLGLVLRCWTCTLAASQAAGIRDWIERLADRTAGLDIFSLKA